MSKYHTFFASFLLHQEKEILYTFDEIKNIGGIELDHSFLNCKKELLFYHYEVKKISLKNKTILFSRIEKNLD